MQINDFIGKQIDRYHITERLGMGGMAVVYKAYDTRLERDVALKLIRTEAIPPEQYPRLMKRFEREAKSQARFDHKHIVHVYDYGEVDGAPYLVMAYIPGVTLKAHTGKPIPYQQAIRWLIPVADALSYAHQKGVIHRDIKPSNILFDEDGQPILTDFGIAKILETDEATLTGTGLGVGTPEYMAPEQWRGQAFPSTDQYALGVVLYELLTGEKPYKADTPAAVAILQATEPLRRPGTLAPGIPESVEKLLFKALANSPPDRYEDMAAMRKALERQLTVTPADAPEPVAAIKPAPEPVPSQPRPEPGSEAETVDILEPTPVEISNQPVRRRMVQRIRTEESRGGPLPAWALWMVGAGLFFIVLVAGIGLLGRYPGREPTATAESTNAGLVLDDKPMPNNTETPAPMVTDTQSPSPTFTETSIPTQTNTFEPTLGIGSTMVNPIDGAVMVYVPEGEFLMGSEDEKARDNEKPAHMVYLDAFWIYKYEVSNREYRLCMEENVCSTPIYWPFYDNQDYSDHPVVDVNWFDANNYCQWAGGRLPTEAEWEKTARGTDGRKYPWGDQSPTCNLANYRGCIGGTTQIGRYQEGASPYGALDLAGNVFEWVADQYNPNYYRISPYRNPTGPETGSLFVYRGGSWEFDEYYMSVSNRFGARPDTSISYLGFRCVYTNEP